MCIQVDLASHPDVASDAIYDAIINPLPKTRYVVANVGGIPAKFLTFIADTTTDRFRDFIYLKKFE